MKRKKRPIMLSGTFISILVVAVVLSLQNDKSWASTLNDAPLTLTEHAMRSNNFEGKSYQSKLTIGAIGDILIHDRVYEDARINDGFDFKPMFTPVKEMLRKPDILLANQETILGGVELGLSGYPTFNSPHEVGYALVDVGVDIVSTANNHTLDKGAYGVQSSLAFLTEIGLPYVGSYKDVEDQQRLRILRHNGVDIAYLSYTYGTNGIPVPNGKEYLVNLIDKEKMQAEIHRAKTAADLIVMSIHWGNEYQRYPNDSQVDLAHFLVKEGVDIIFGHHPHVLQPIEWLETAEGDKALVVYSLGNFLSGQKWDYKDIGGLLTVELTKKVSPNETTVELKDATFQPTYVSSSGQQNYRVVPLENADDYGLEMADIKYQEIISHMTAYTK